jgi:flagellar protein FliO/FliZ
MSLRTSTLTILLALAGAAPALAANGEGTKLDLRDAPAAASGDAGASGGSLVRTIVGLVVVIAVIYGLTWVLKQVKQSREASATGAGLSTLATLPLGPNRSLHLVQAGDEVVLLGTGEGGVSTIRTYSAAEARALGMLDDEPDAADRILEGVRRARNTTSAPAATARAGFVEELRRKTIR